MPDPGPSSLTHERLAAWTDRLAERTFRDLTFPEVRRALQALSSLYVRGRDRLGRGAALDGRGKRAAFALFYGPIHFLVVDHVVRRLGLARPGTRHLNDLGCGTGAAGAAWSLACSPAAEVRGHDRNAWAIAEANRTYRELGVPGRAGRGTVGSLRLPGGETRGILAGWVVNELDEAVRARLLPDLVAAGRTGARVLVVEPIARRPLPWWDRWEATFAEAEGRCDAWRFEADLPEPVRELDRAAGLDHRVLTARTLAMGATAEAIP